MVFAMLIIPVSDGIVKLLSEHYSVLFLNWARFLVGGVIFAPLVLILSNSVRLRTGELVSLSWRTILHVVAISLYFLAIARVPLADALGAYFVAPIIAVIVGAVYLREKASLTQFVAVFVGFLGTLLVVQPGASMNVGMLYAVLSGVVFGLFLVLTRKAGQTIAPITTLGFQCFVGAVVLFPVAAFFWEPLTWLDAMLIFVAGVIWAVGHLAIVQAFALATTSSLAPIVYIEIVGGVVVGYMLFGDIPTSKTTMGIVMVVLAGLLVQNRNTAISLRNAEQS